MNRWAALALLLGCAGALALRLPRLGERPLHNDEAINATKLATLLERGEYAYDPKEFHGPTLYYCSMLVVRLAGASRGEQLTDVRLRLTPVLFGIGLLALLPLLADGLGKRALAWSAIFTAVSPAMVFYSRYFIHEMLLDFFTMLTIAGGWRYTQRGGFGWATVVGAGAGLMIATKETFILAFAAMVFALAATLVWDYWRRERTALRIRPSACSVLRRAVRLLRTKMQWPHVVCGLLVTLLIWLVLFSSFFTHWSGLLDSFRTFLPWLGRAQGDSPHIHRWWFYLERLAWFHKPYGRIWTELPILALALGGIVSAFRSSHLNDGSGSLARFLSFYTVLLTVIYAAIPYKTPWCLLSFWHGALLLAGIGANALMQLSRRLWCRLTAFAAVLAATGFLTAESWRTVNMFSAENGHGMVMRSNPYVYAQTSPQVRELVERIRELAATEPTGKAMTIQVVSPESYWPLPWYLRDFKNVGWYDRLPNRLDAPVLLIAAGLNPRLEEDPSRSWRMTGLYELRPGVFFELYVGTGSWQRFLDTRARH